MYCSIYIHRPFPIIIMKVWMKIVMSDFITQLSYQSTDIKYIYGYFLWNKMLEKFRTAMLD